MGSNSICKLGVSFLTLITALLFLAQPAWAAPARAGAVDSLGDSARITATAAQTITIPYSFTPIDFSGYSGPSLPSIDFASVDFINQAGSIGLTLYGILADYAILAYFALVAIGVMIVFAVWGFVTNRPSVTALNVTGAIDVGADLYDAQSQYQQNNPPPWAINYNQAPPMGQPNYPKLGSGQQLDFRKAARAVLGARRLRW